MTKGMSLVVLIALIVRLDKFTRSLFVHVVYFRELLLCCDVGFCLCRESIKVALSPNPS